MLNIKNCFMSYPKTYKKAINYDDHNYKEDRLKKDDEVNVRLVDNVALFEAELDAYKKDLRACYKAETHNKLKKTDKEISKVFHSSKIMRSFRISCNHIELNSLHRPNDTEAQKRQNIINYYSDILNQFSDLLNKNNKFCHEVQIVQADIHFDQTSPHLHVHVSNLYEREVKKLKRKDVNTCNAKISDAIDMLKVKQKEVLKEEGIKLAPNEIFARSLRNVNSNYALTNKVDLKKLFPDQYDLFTLKRNAKLDEKSWRLDKELFFTNAKANLIKFGLKVDQNNDIKNTIKLNELTQYCWTQTLFKQFTKDKNRNINEISAFLGNNKAIANMLDKNKNTIALEQAIKELNTQTSFTSQNLNNVRQLNRQLAFETKKQNNALFKSMITPNNLITNENLNNISMDIAFFRPNLSKIESEIKDTYFLSKDWRKINGKGYVEHLAEAMLHPDKKLNYKLNNKSFISNDIIDKDINKEHKHKIYHKNNQVNNHSNDYLLEQHTHQDHYKRTRTLADIEREEELKRQQEYRRSM